MPRPDCQLVNKPIVREAAKTTDCRRAIEKGVLDLTLDGVLNTLKVGDSIYYDGDCLHGFANSGRTACAYYRAMDVSGELAGAQHRIKKDADPGDHAGVRRPQANGTTAPGPSGGGASRVLRKALRRPQQQEWRKGA